MSDKQDRRHPRYHTEVHLNFYMPINLETKVNYQVQDAEGTYDSSKHTGSTRNIAAGGLCFRSDEDLPLGILLRIELLLPNSDEVIYMEGEVRWSHKIEDEQNQYDTGVQLIKVQDKPVDDTIYFDEKYQVVWSETLEQVLGGFAKLNRDKTEIN